MMESGMIYTFSRLNFLARAFLVAIAVFFSHQSLAVQPSQAQLEQFKSLPASQQARLAKQFGVSVPRAGGSQSSAVVQTASVAPISKAAAVAKTGGEVKTNTEMDEGKLPAFGYDLFAGQPTTFAPITDVPVSSDYVLGPGDSLKVNLYGKESQFFELFVDQEGQVYIPDLGPMNLAGLDFSEAKEKIKKTIDQKMIGVKASVSMGSLRSIRVFVLGEARVPGSYVISSLSTMTNALVLSGGVSELGSLRNIQLKRKGELVQTLDVYDLLLKGDTSGDAQLKSGDVIFIPTVGPQVAIKGQIKRPAYYELKGKGLVADLLSYSGGMLASAYPQRATLERVSELNERQFLNLDLSSATDLNLTLRNGDQVTLPKILPKVENIVKVLGHVERTETHRWVPGLRVSDVIRSIEYLRPEPDLNYALIKRYQNPERALSVHSFSIGEVLNAKGGAVDPVLHDRDELIFFGLYGDRSGEMAALVQELRRQANITEASKEVSIAGNVRYPAVYPLVEGMTIAQLISASGGLTEKAYLSSAELNRTIINEQQARIQERNIIKLSDSEALSIQLQARDVLTIKAIPEWAETKQITLRGEVRFPGTYPFHKNDTLVQVVERAGGLTEYAYAPGAMFTRVDLKRQQAKQLEEMQTRLESDIAKAEVVTANQTTLDESKSQSLGEAQGLLDKLKNTEALGRLVIDLEKVLEGQGDYIISLKDGDELYIPEKKSSVTVIGEVQLPVSQLFDQELGYWEYIERSGGLTDKADDDRIYVIKANGGVQIPGTSSWFAGSSAKIAPGDTIVVPLDADKVDQVILWRDMSQIFYQIALGAAAVGSL
jgi:polysaccharide biosynthesis/export protein